MGKGKMKMLEVYMDRLLDETTAVKIDGEIWPYLINRKGTVWGRPYIELRPYIDSKRGILMHTLRRNGEEHEIPLALLIARTFVPNENGYNHARVKSGDPTNISSYYVENIEWYEDEGEDNSNVDTNANVKYNISDVGIIACCRFRQCYKDKDIASELGLSVDETKSLISKYHPMLSKQFEFCEDPDTTRRRKFRAIRPFIVYLINNGTDHKKVQTEIKTLVPEASDSQVYTTIRVACRNDSRILPQFRRK